jgi:hypothetical protein
MGKLIFWIVVVFVVLFAVRVANAAKSRARQPRRDEPRRAADRAASGTMVRCVECGVFLPAADARTGVRGPTCTDPACTHRRDRAR